MPKGPPTSSVPEGPEKGADLQAPGSPEAEAAAAAVEAKAGEEEMLAEKSDDEKSQRREAKSGKVGKLRDKLAGAENKRNEQWEGVKASKKACRRRQKQKRGESGG